MRRLKLLWIVPFLAAGLVFAQQSPEATETAEELILKLGSEDYAVREGATRRLVELGEKAAPALERALNSEDIEVRMRAGRALRAIRDGREAKPTQKSEAEGGAAPTRRNVQNRSYSIEMGNGRVKVRVKEVVDGQEQTREYEGESLEQLKKEHPELNEMLGGFQFRLGTAGRPGSPLDFDSEKFWEEWNQGMDEDFWKDLKREQERTEKWMQRLQDQRKRMMEEFRQRFDTRAQGAALGVHVTRPEPVLDAQLDLRGRGLVVESVDPGTLGDRLGLQRFDILTSLNGVEIAAPQDVASALREWKQGQKATASIIRRGRAQELKTGE